MRLPEIESSEDGTRRSVGGTDLRGTSPSNSRRAKSIPNGPIALPPLLENPSGSIFPDMPLRLFLPLLLVFASRAFSLDVSIPDIQRRAGGAPGTDGSAGVGGVGPAPEPARGRFSAVAPSAPGDTGANATISVLGGAANVPVPSGGATLVARADGHGEVAGSERPAMEGGTAGATTPLASTEPRSRIGMVRIPAGCFQMGSNSGLGAEKPVHEVCLSAFSMDATEVTQAAYRQATGSNPSKFTYCGDDCPVEVVTWDEARSYCERVGERLPTEAEWEYAARAGTTTAWFWGDDDARRGEFAWSDGNSGIQTHPVGRKKPNAWGLYDMAGNVWEWTAYWFGESYYSRSRRQNPLGPASGSHRVVRGGSWFYESYCLQSAYRDAVAPDNRSPFLGFRCVASGP